MTRGETTYARAKRKHENYAPARSVRFMRIRGRGVACFDSLFLPRTGNHGVFCRAPRTVRS